jgi:hypothetical protein
LAVSRLTPRSLPTCAAEAEAGRVEGINSPKTIARIAIKPKNDVDMSVS